MTPARGAAVALAATAASSPPGESPSVASSDGAAASPPSPRASHSPAAESTASTSPSSSTPTRVDPDPARPTGPSSSKRSRASAQAEDEAASPTPSDGQGPTTDKLARVAADEGSSTGASNSEAAAAAAAAAAKAASNNKLQRTTKACTYCRRLKMRCTGGELGPPCHRCKRLGKECVFSIPARSRASKSAAANKDRQIENLAQRLAQMEKKLGTTISSGEAGAAPGDQVGVGGGGSGGGDVLGSTPSELPASGRGGIAARNERHAATNGGVTLAEHGHHGPVRPPPSPPPPSLLPTTADPDRRLAAHDRVPVLARGVVTPREAYELFRLYMDKMNDAVCLLDPEWHTPERVSSRSAFLYTCILNVAAIYYAAPPRGPALGALVQAEVDQMIGPILTQGTKSVDIVQGFMLLYFWNRPTAKAEEDKAYMYSGIAMRMASYINLNRSDSERIAQQRQQQQLASASVGGGAGGPSTSSSSWASPLAAAGSGVAAAAVPHYHAPPRVSEAEREAVNRERTWLLLFCIDRTLSLAMGKPWTLREDALVRRVHAWRKQPSSRPWDEAIALLADLVRVFCRQFEILHSSSSSPGQLNRDLDFEQIIPVFNDELNSWRSHGYYIKHFFSLHQASLYTRPARDRRPRRKPGGGDTASSAASGADGGAGGTTADTASQVPVPERPEDDYEELEVDAALQSDATRHGFGRLDREELSNPDWRRDGQGARGDEAAAAHVPVPDVHLEFAFQTAKQMPMRINYLLLVLNSFALQRALEQPASSTLRIMSLIKIYESAKGVIQGARDHLDTKLTYAPHTQFVILSYSIVTLIRLSTLPGGGAFNPERALQWAEEGTSLLDRVATGPMHTPARYASFLRALLRTRQVKKASATHTASSLGAGGTRPGPSVATYHYQAGATTGGATMQAAATPEDVRRGPIPGRPKSEAADVSNAAGPSAVHFGSAGAALPARDSHQSPHMVVAGLGPTLTPSAAPTPGHDGATSHEYDGLPSDHHHHVGTAPSSVSFSALTNDAGSGGAVSAEPRRLSLAEILFGTRNNSAAALDVAGADGPVDDGGDAGQRDMVAGAEGLAADGGATATEAAVAAAASGMFQGDGGDEGRVLHGGGGMAPRVVGQGENQVGAPPPPPHADSASASAPFGPGIQGGVLLPTAISQLPSATTSSRAMQAFQGLDIEAFSGLDRLTVDQILDDGFWASPASTTSTSTSLAPATAATGATAATATGAGDG